MSSFLFVDWAISVILKDCVYQGKRRCEHSRAEFFTLRANDMNQVAWIQTKAYSITLHANHECPEQPQDRSFCFTDRTEVGRSFGALLEPVSSVPGCSQIEACEFKVMCSPLAFMTTVMEELLRMKAW
jgi:hypothetical protein